MVQANNMADVHKTSLNTATVRQQWNLTEAVEACARHGIRGISPWRDQIQEAGLQKIAKQIGDAGLQVTGVCRGGMFPVANPADRQSVIDDNKRAIEEAATLKADCLVLVTGGLPGTSKDLAGAQQQVEDTLGELLPFARAAGVPLAIEALHPMYAADRACVNTLGHANDLCEKLGDGLGVAVDVYHLWWDPELQQQIFRAGRERLLAFHVCDWLVPTEDLLLDRGMMGDGVIDIALIRSWIESAGYEGFYEVEIFSQKNWWKRDGDEVLNTVKQRVEEFV
jgi:sugar phosphate isomerase/epimerase